MSKQVSWDLETVYERLPESVRNAKLPKGDHTTAPPGFADKFKVPEKMTLKPCLDYVSPFNIKKEVQLAQCNKTVAALEAQIADYKQEIASKLYDIERERSHQETTSSLLDKEFLGINISVFYCEIEILKLKIKKQELLLAKYKDDWNRIMNS